MFFFQSKRIDSKSWQGFPFEPQEVILYVALHCIWIWFWAISYFEIRKGIHSKYCKGIFSVSQEKLIGNRFLKEFSLIYEKGFYSKLKNDSLRILRTSSTFRILKMNSFKSSKVFFLGILIMNYFRTIIKKIFPIPVQTSIVPKGIFLRILTRFF